ncbi:MAG: hypothetical protein WA840_12015 [Caulobacteraceae bacterium]
MTSYKLNEDDDGFLQLPQGALLVASGGDGAETWIERAKDATVRVVVASVAVATADGASLEAVIEVDGARAHGATGPEPADTHLQSIQSVQLVVRPDQRVRFKAYPNPVSARVLKTVVYTHDLN